MNILDLTYVISLHMPVYPGTEGPTLSPANTYEKDGFKETLLSMYSHTGTHMDAPAHVFAGRASLDELPASQFVGKATVIDCTHLGEGGKITMEQVRSNPDAQQADFLLFHTGWGKRLTYTRNIVKQNVTVCKNSHQNLFNNIALSDNNLFNFFNN